MGAGEGARLRTIARMVDPHRLLALVATALVIIVIPGPSVLFVISRGVTLGRRAGLATVIGNESGLIVQVAAVAAGIGAIVSRSIVVFTTIKIVGGLYLVISACKQFAIGGPWPTRLPSVWSPNRSRASCVRDSSWA